jgi:hypothetical protein
MLRRLLKLFHWILFQSEHSKGHFGKEFRRGWTIVLLVSAINFAIESRHWYERFEWADLDRLQSSIPNPLRWSDTFASRNQITLIFVTESDYSEMFARKSPLDSQKVLKLIRSICKFGPKILGVDLLAADWTNADHKEAVGISATCPVAWIQDVDENGADESGSGRDAEAPVRLSKVAGESMGGGLCTAVPVMRPDADCVIRNYQTHIPVVDPGSFQLGSPFATFMWTLASNDPNHIRCGFDQHPPPDWNQEKKIRFSGNRRFVRLPLRMLMSAGENETLRKSITSLLMGKVVILGGAYREARDEHRTPIGPLYGSEILANAVATESFPIEEATPWKTSLVDLLVATALLAFVISRRFRWLWALLISTALSAIAALMLCWFMYRYFGYFLGVFGSLAGVVLGVIVELSWDHMAEGWKRWWPQFKTQWMRTFAGKGSTF